MFPLQLAERGRRSSNMDPLPQLFQHFVLVCSKNQSNICKPLSQIGQPGPTMGTKWSGWGPNGPDGARRPILIDLGGLVCEKTGLPCEKLVVFGGAAHPFFHQKSPWAIFWEPGKPFHFFETPCEDPFGRKKCDFGRLGPLCAECILT